MKQYLSKNNLNSTLTDPEQFTMLKSKPVKSKILQSVMEERVWKNCDYHSLDNWKFRLSTEGQRFEYKSPDGEVFNSRGSLLRVLIKQGRTSYSELMMLKKLLKNNDNKINLKENDRFIRTLPVNQNFLIFIKTRYCFFHLPFGNLDKYKFKYSGTQKNRRIGRRLLDYNYDFIKSN